MTEISSVVTLILNWNGAEDTIRCVHSVLKGDYAANEVVIIDNGSTDGSEERLRAEFPDIKLIQTGANLGFAGGMNVGIRDALLRGASFVWLLNNDTRVDARSLSAMVEVAKSDPCIGAVGGVIHDMVEPAHILAWGGGVIQWGTCQTKHLNTEGNPDYLTGASVLIPSKSFKNIGLLDESFFMYWEDVDFSLRLIKNGMKISVAPNSILWHSESASLGKNSEKLVLISIKSNIVFAKKWCKYPKLQLIPVLVARYLKKIIVGDFSRASAIMGAIRSEWVD